MDILLVEDDTHLGGSILLGLREAGFQTRLVNTAAAAREAVRTENWRVIVLDLGLPDGDGLELLREWRGQAIRIPLIITTARGELEDRLRGLESGADDYLVKPYAFSELMARIRVQVRHAEQAETQDYRMADLHLNLRSRVATRGESHMELTPREFDLLAYLLENRGQVVTRDMLARHVWHVQSRMTSLDNVIDVHMSRLREKLDRGHEARLLHTVRGVGFVVREAGS